MKKGRGNELRRSTRVAAWLAFLILVPGALPGLEAATPRNASDAAVRIDQLLSGLYPLEEPGAVVLVAKGDDIILRKAYGLANLELRVPMTVDAVFRVASVAKLFTATAILMLMEEGKLRLDDEVTVHVPDYPTRGKTLTLRHLLTHTSGIPDCLGRPDARSWIRNDLDLSELIDSFADRKPSFDPGEASAYSNSNYALLAAVIERASGQGYPEFLRERVFGPAEMRTTLLGGQSPIVPHRAAGYETQGTGFINEKFYSMTILAGSGDALSTVDDLHRWFRAFFGGKLVEPETVALSLQAARLNGGEPTSFGCGWELHRAGARLAAMKGGAISGFTHYVLALPGEELYVILLTNRGGDEGRRPGRLCQEIAGIAVD